MSSKSDLHHILNKAKWAPSGDNTQPWFIEVLSDTEFKLNLTQFKKNVYNLIPMSDYVTIGMFIENARLAAHHLGYDLSWQVQDEEKVFVSIAKTEDVSDSALYPYIETRSVNRFPYKLKLLKQTIKHSLKDILDDDIRVVFYEPFYQRLSIGRLMMLLTSVRLKLPEIYEVHRDMIDWADQDSIDKMPKGSLGANPFSLKMMKWALAKKNRNQFLMKLPLSTLSFEIELDLIPALMCSGHFVMAFDPLKTPKPGISDYIRGGQSMQRFWLTLTQNDMTLQPWYIVLTFSRYIKENLAFTSNQRLHNRAKKVHDYFTQKVLKPYHLSLDHVFFTGRLGYPTKTNIRRSVRKDLDL